MIPDTDRELLEFAAKAAGICGEYDQGIFIADSYFPNGSRFWNPLTDDGDALRLAVKLGMIIGTYAAYSVVDLLSPNDRIESIEEWHSNNTNAPYAATRRAIVRAAAEIGRNMK